MGLFSSRISRIEAEGIAREVAAGEGWPWRGEADVMWGWRRWKVKSNRGSVGCHVWVEIDRQTGAVIRKKFIPR